MVKKMVKFLNINELKTIRRIGCLGAVIGAIIFIILTILAMLTSSYLFLLMYRIPYNFLYDYFSDLGRALEYIIIPITQIPIKIVPLAHDSILWDVAIIIVAISFFPFWIIIQTLFRDNKKMKIISIIGSILGVISTLFFIAVAVFPVDIKGKEHLISGDAFFILVSAAILLYSLDIFLRPEYYNKYAILGVAIVIFIAFFYIVSIFFSAMIIISITRPNPLLQKLSVYSIILWVVVQTCRVWSEVGPPKT